METSVAASLVSEKSIVVQRKEALPAHINKLKSFVIFQEQVALNFKSRLLLLKETNAAKAQVDATFEDALKVSEMLFQAYERLGQLVEQHSAKPKESGKAGGRGRKGHTGATTLLTVRGLAKEMGVSQPWLQQMKLIAKNPQRTREAFKLARELGPEAGIAPTKTQIINSIRSAERQVQRKRHKVEPSELHKCTEAVLEALNHLMEAARQKPRDSEVAAFNDAVSNFQERLGEFQRYANQEEADAPEIASSEKSRRLQLPDLIQRWMKLNWKPLFRRLLITTANRA